ncbi:GumC family protein [Variovorax ginsengisoli]|uniref:Uncharacterized protein involved in exopolysaccharide biosynthesis n=1 Tax=Variovorax ginsengisoli TaxID=363844 RepID=A0ABT9SCV1_9BURK|nr:Wzz/FepE/Etk N-terminal domain-containing protein [Variovorax ginsengisoli]MDP9902181.1 uncharacterized protein involved in exopolysaccharide biosynthesis [Variovorax ginsengisoli]
MLRADRFGKAKIQGFSAKLLVITVADGSIKRFFDYLICMTFPNSNGSAEQTTSLRGATSGAGEISILDVLQILIDNLRVLVIFPLIVGILALAISFLIKPIFTASTKFLPPQQQQGAAAAMLQSLGSLGGLAAGASGLKNPADQYIGFLKSESVQDPLINQFGLVDRFDVKYRSDARRVLESRTRISNGKDGLIVIDYDDQDPKIAAEIANAYVKGLGSLLSRLAVTEAQQRRLFFEKQLFDAKNKLIKSEQALKASGVSSSVLRVSPQSAVEGIARLQAQITAQEVKVASMRGYLMPASPDLKQAQNELNAIKSQLIRAQQEEPQAAKEGAGDYIALYRDFKYSETLFELFARQYEAARVDESKEGAIIQVVDVAQIPEKKSGPKREIIALAATFLSFILTIIFVLVRNAFKRKSDDSRLAEKFSKLRIGLKRALGFKK